VSEIFHNPLWLSNLPSEWKLEKIKHIFTDRNEKNESGNDNYLSLMKDVGIVPYSEKGNVGNKTSDTPEKYKMVYRNDIVVNPMNVLIGSVGLSKYDGCLSSVYIVLKPNEGTYPKFFHYVFFIKEFQKYLRRIATGIMEIRESVGKTEFFSEKLPVPPLQEQKLISEYLDKKVTDIDQLIKKIEEKIDLLKEQKDSLINHYIFKGVTQNPLMKDSQIGVVGSVPSHWKVQRLKTVLKVYDVRSETGEEELLSVTIGNGVVKRREYLDDDDEHLSRAESLEGYKLVKQNDLVNNIMKMSFCCLGISPHDGIVSPAYSVFTVDKNTILVGYLHQLLRTENYVVEYRRGSTGIQESRMRLYDDDFLNIAIPIPPMDEQKKILDILLEKEEVFKKVVDVELARITKLKEYKESLISSIVSGKVRITEEML